MVPMSMLRRYSPLPMVTLLLAWVSCAAAADMPAGCDTTAAPPMLDLSHPPNLGIFKDQLLRYRCTNYEKDIAAVLQEARDWIKQRAPQVRNPAIVLDIDETSLSNWKQILQDEYPFPPHPACSFKQEICSDRDWKWSQEAPAIQPVLDLYKLAQCIDTATPCTKVDVYFVTGRRDGDKYVPKEICNQPVDKCDPSLPKTPAEWTLGNLQKAGFAGVPRDHLYMRPKDSSGQVSDFKKNQRIAIENLGKTIIANVGDQESDLAGLHAERTFKVPNPFYFIP